MFKLNRPWTLSTLALASAAVLAQAPVPPAPATQGPAGYQSAFSDYKPYADAKRGDWFELNQTVGVLGGHNAALRGAVQVVNSNGTVLEIDLSRARARIDHEAIKELGWPATTAFWPLKDAALASGIKPGERVGFRLELIGDGYKITAFGPTGTPPPAKAEAPNPHAGHNMARPASPPNQSVPAAKPASPAAKPASPPPKPASPPAMPGIPPGHKM